MMKTTTLLLAVLFVTAAAWAGDTHITPRSDANPTRTGTSPVPAVIVINSVLLDAQSHPVPGTRNVLISLYSDQQGGSPIWQEAQTVVADGNGNIAVAVGAATPGGVPSSLFSSGAARWIEVFCPDATTRGRMMMISSPYAMMANDSNMLGGVPASQYMRVNSVAQQNVAQESDLQAEVSARQQADANLLQQAKAYSDAAIQVESLAISGTANMSASGVQAETIRARQQEASLGTQVASETARATQVENSLSTQIGAVQQAMSSLPHGTFILTASPIAPAGYLSTGLTVQAGGSPTPEAQNVLGSAAAQSQSNFTLYVYMKN